MSTRHPPKKVYLARWFPLKAQDFDKESYCLWLMVMMLMRNTRRVGTKVGGYCDTVHAESDAQGGVLYGGGGAPAP